MKKIRATKMLMPITTLIVCAIGLGTQFVHAGTAIESFEYTVGSRIDGQNGGTGWNGAWIPVTGTCTNGVAGAGSLTYPGITSAGNKLVKANNASNGDTRVRRFFDTAYNSGTVYFSAIMQRTNETLRYFGMCPYYDNTERMMIGAGTGYTNWMISRITNVVGSVVISDVPTTQASLLVVKIEFNASEVDNSFEQVTFWVNPDLSQPESVATAVGGQSYSTDRDFATINGVRLGGAGNNAADGPASDGITDEVRVSTESPFATVLNITVANSEAQLSWPAPGWTLQKASALGTPITWIDITGTETITATNLPVGEPVEFFRLYKE